MTFISHFSLTLFINLTFDSVERLHFKEVIIIPF